MAAYGFNQAGNFFGLVRRPNLKITVNSKDACSLLKYQLRRIEDIAAMREIVHRAVSNAVLKNFTAGGRPTWLPRQSNRKWSHPTLIKTGGLRALATRIQTTTRVTRDREATFTSRAAVGRVGYAHNFGFSGHVHRKEHYRTMTSIFGKKLRRPITVKVRAHEMNATVIPRPFFTMTIEDLNLMLLDIEWLVRGRRVGGKQLTMENTIRFENARRMTPPMTAQMLRDREHYYAVSRAVEKVKVAPKGYGNKARIYAARKRTRQLGMSRDTGTTFAHTHRNRPARRWTDTYGWGGFRSGKFYRHPSRKNFWKGKWPK